MSKEKKTKEKTFERPLNLAPNDGKPDLDKIKYPTLVMPKLDGVRFVVRDGVAYSRTWKPMHKSLQEYMKPFLEKTAGTNHILDGEVWSPDLAFNEITHTIAHANEKSSAKLWLYCFDYMTTSGWDEGSVTRYEDRRKNLINVLRKLDPKAKYADIVDCKLCNNKEEVLAYYEELVAAGGEGAMLRSPDQLYKFGRSTMKESPEKGGGFYKLKAWSSVDGYISGFTQKSRLTEEAKATNTEKNELGRTKRGHRKGDRELVEELGSVEVTIPSLNLVCNPSFKKDNPMREEITWENREQYLKRWVEVEYLPCGTIVDEEDRSLRHPRIMRFREDLDE